MIPRRTAHQDVGGLGTKTSRGGSRRAFARGLSQRDLAGKLDLKEQQIQRYESEEYASASLRRLAEVANALNLNISESANFSPSLPSGRKADAENLRRH
jgi:transcriptional regulator with XRE-family HTH domain